MLHSMGSQRVGHDLVTEQQSPPCNHCTTKINAVQHRLSAAGITTKRMAPDTMCFLTERCSHRGAVLPKTTKPESKKAPELTANLQEIWRTGEQAEPHHGNLQEIWRTGEQAKPHHGDITGESRTVRNFIG